MTQQALRNMDSSGSPSPEDQDDDLDLTGFVSDELPLRVEDFSGEITTPDDGTVVEPVVESRERAPADPASNKAPVVDPKVVPPAPAAAPPVQQTPAPVEAPQQPAPSAPQTVDFVQTVMANRAKYTSELAKHFTIGEPELQVLDSNPAEFFANLRATIYLDGLLAQAQIMRDALPRIIDSHARQRQTETDSANEFFTRHSDLQGKEHETDLVNMATLLAQQEPGLKADREKFMDRLAQVYRVLKGLPTPQAGKPAPKPRPGFAPAISRGAMPVDQRVAAPRGPMNEEEQIATIFDQIAQDRL